MSNSNKIVLINSVFKEKSTGRICYDLSKELNKHGVDTFVMYGRGKKKNDQNCLKVGNVVTTAFSGISARIFDNDGFNNFLATKKMISIIKRENPSIVHLHNLHGYYVNIKLLLNFLKSKKIKTIITLHDSWLYTGHCCYYIKNKCDLWERGCNHCKHKNEYPRSILFNRSSKNFLAKKQLLSNFSYIKLITPSNWLAGEIKKSFLQSNEPIVVNNGIDLSVFFDRNNRVSDEYVRILGVNSIWDERKGLGFFHYLDQHLPDKFVITIVGKISKKEAKRYSFSDRTHFVNYLCSTDELAEIYSNHDLFINPTLEDNYPTSCLESIACGTPVICFDNGGAAETVFDGCGSVISENQEELLKTVIAFKKTRILVDDELSSKLSIQSFLKKMIDIYFEEM